jgi:mannose-6-phosphate isomerase-like protein (cupin superfamily)
MKSKYLDLQTGEVINARQLLDWEKGKDRIWEAADELYSLLANKAKQLEEESHMLLLEASHIRDLLKTYEEATDTLDSKERKHLAAKKQRVAFIAPDEGNSFWLAGELYTAKAVGEDTGGTYTLVEAKTQPKGQSLPKINYREDTTYYVLEGELEFMVEDNLSKVSAGYLLYVGRGTWHTYKNVGTRPARHLEMITPAGIEKFFEEVSVPALDTSSPPPFEKEDLDKILSIAPKYGLEIRPIPESYNRVSKNLGSRQPGV